MKVLLSVTHISKDGAFGGPVSVALSQAKGLVRAGHEVTLVAGWDGEVELDVPGVELVLLESLLLPGMGFVVTRTPRLRRWLHQNVRRFDVVHVHGGRHLFDVTVAAGARRASRPYFVQTHGMVLPSTRPSVMMADRLGVLAMLRHARAVLALTDDEVRALRGLDRDLVIKRVRNGIETSSVTSADAQEEILFLARLHPRKRVLAFAEMARLVHSTHPRAQFAVVGPDEGELASLRQFMEAHPEVPIRYEGAVPPGAAPSRIASAMVYVLPSSNEVFPMTVLEALSVGTPTVLVEDCGIADELSRQGAALVSDGRPEDLAGRVRGLLESPERRRSLAVNGRRAVASSYSADAVVRSLLGVYAEAPSDRGILWMTNTAAPYRLPVWAAMAEVVPLDVLLMESDRRLAKDANNRGSDWETTSQPKGAFRLSVLKTLVAKRGEGRYYFGWVGTSHLRGRRAVVLGGWESPIYWLAVLRARRARVRTVGFYESHSASQGHARGPVAALRGRYFRSLDAVVTPGPAATEAVLRMRVSRHQIHEGFNAVDVNSIRLQVESRPPRDGDADRLRLIYVGQLIPRKNVAALLTAIAPLPHITLTVVGTGEQRGDLEQLVINQFDDPSRVSFAGYVAGAEVPAVMAEHDALVLPSLAEVWGLVVNEALACGLHVVVSRRAGVAPSVEHHPGVQLCDPDVADLASTLASVRLPVRKIQDPPIWRETPEAFAQVFLGASVGAESPRGGRTL